MAMKHKIDWSLEMGNWVVSLYLAAKRDGAIIVDFVLPAGIIPGRLGLV